MSMSKEKEVNSLNNFRSEILSWNCVNSLPAELNPEIKVEILNLSKEYELTTIATKLNIPLKMLHAWNMQYLEVGEREFVRLNRAKNNGLTRAQKVQILGEVENIGMKNASTKYGIHKNAIKSWERKISCIGIQRFLEKIKINSVGNNKKFCRAEKLRILRECEEEGRGETAIKYDVTEHIIDAWKGRLNYFGEKALECNGYAARVKFTQEMKARVVESYKEIGVNQTTRTYGATRGCIYNWKKQIDQKGLQAFLQDEPVEERVFSSSNRVPVKKVSLDNSNLLSQCGLFRDYSYGQQLLPQGEGEHIFGVRVKVNGEEEELRSKRDMPGEININIDSTAQITVHSEPLFPSIIENPEGHKRATEGDLGRVGGEFGISSSSSLKIFSNEPVEKDIGIIPINKEIIPMKALGEKETDISISTSTNKLSASQIIDKEICEEVKIPPICERIEVQIPSVVCSSSEVNGERNTMRVPLHYIQKRKLFLKEIEELLPPIMFRKFKAEFKGILHTYVKPVLLLCNNCTLVQ